MALTVFPLTAFHQQQWIALWRGYLDFYKVDDLSPQITQQTFEAVCTQKMQGGFGAFEGDEMLGFVHYLVHPSTWSLNGYCYLEDLYVSARARGKGAGRALIEAVYAEADRRDLSRVYWVTDQENKTAQILYDRLANKANFIQYRR